MTTISWQPFDEAAQSDVDKDYVYQIRTKEGAEFSGMYPNGAGFHCMNPNEGRRVAMSDVTHYAQQMTFDDHADQYVFNHGKV